MVTDSDFNFDVTEYFGIKDSFLKKPPCLLSLSRSILIVIANDGDGVDDVLPSMNRRKQSLDWTKESSSDWLTNDRAWIELTRV